VEIISASSSGEDILEIGKHIALANTSQNAEIPEIALFPSNYLIGNTITLHAGSVFGFERLDKTFTAHYIVSGQELTAFISLRKTAAEATELITSYCQFLIDNGGSIVDHPSEISTAKIVHLFDTYEVVFTNGPMLAGVHEAENEDAAMELASLLYRGFHRELR
jgi:hypothetical protein